MFFKAPWSGARLDLPMLTDQIVDGYSEVVFEILARLSLFLCHWHVSESLSTSSDLISSLRITSLSSNLLILWPPSCPNILQTRAHCRCSHNIILTTTRKKSPSTTTSQMSQRSPQQRRMARHHIFVTEVRRTCRHGLMPRPEQCGHDDGKLPSRPWRGPVGESWCFYSPS